MNSVSWKWSWAVILQLWLVWHEESVYPQPILPVSVTLDVLHGHTHSLLNGGSRITAESRG